MKDIVARFQKYGTKSEIIILCLFTIVSLIILRVPVIHSGEILSGGLDSQATFSQSPSQFINNWILSDTWSWWFGTPTQIFFPLHYQWPFVLIGMVFHLNSEKFILIEYFLIYIIAGYGAFLLVKLLLSKNSLAKPKVQLTASILSGLFYVFSPFMIAEYSHGAARFGYAIGPWLLFFLYKSLSSRKISFAILVGIMWSIVGTPDFRWSAYGAVIIIIFIITSVLDLKTSNFENRKELRRIILVAATSFVIFFAISVPRLIFGTTEILHSIKPTLEALTVVYDKSMTMSTIIRGMQMFLSAVLFTNPPSLITSLGGLPIILSFVIPFLTFLGILFNRKNGTVIFWSFVAIIDLLIISPYPPIAQFRLWLFSEAPLATYLGRIFRGSTMDYFTFLSYCILIGFCLYACLLWIDSHFQRIGKYAIYFAAIAIFALSIVISYWPLVTGNLNGGYQPVNVPGEFRRVNDWLNGLQNNGRALWLPDYFYDYSTWNQVIGSLQFYDVITSKKPTFSLYSSSYVNPFYRLLFSVRELKPLIFSKAVDNYSKFLSLINVNYLVIHDDLGYPHQQSFAEQIIETLNSQKNIEKIKK